MTGHGNTRASTIFLVMARTASISQVLTFTLALVILAIASVFFISFRQSQRVKDTTASVLHTEEVLRHIQDFEISIIANVSASRGYLITGRDFYLEDLRISEELIEKQIERIEYLTRDNPIQSRRCDSLKMLARDRIAFSRRSTTLAPKNEDDTSHAAIMTLMGRIKTDSVRNLTASMKTTEYSLLEVRRSANERTVSTLNIILYSILAAGVLLSILVIHRIRTGIRRQQLNEEKFRALLDAAPDATVIVNESGLIKMVNHQTENLFGYNRNELLDKPVEILMPVSLKSAHETHRGNYMKAARVRSMGEGLELNAVKKNGQSFPVEISLSPIRTQEGMMVSASVRDITVRKALETELKKSNAELEAFTYSVSHDLRAPLRGIIGFTTILEEDYASKLDDEARRITGIIKNNTEKMGHLIDDLLAFSRMGKQELMKTQLMTDKMVEEIIAELSILNRLETPGRINWNVSPLPPIFADRNTLRQVWINLLSNAIKYSSTRPQAIISVDSYRENNFTIFRIKDNGVGFDAQYSSKLFKVFQRLHSPEEFEGTGVGLALVEKVISRHGGRVWAEGRVNEGATFYFSLPDQ